MAPLTIRAASCCIFSNSFVSYCVHLPHETSAYSSNHLINEKNEDLQWFSVKLEFKFSYYIYTMPSFSLDVVNVFLPRNFICKSKSQVFVRINSVVGWLVHLNGWMKWFNELS